MNRIRTHIFSWRYYIWSLHVGKGNIRCRNYIDHQEMQNRNKNNHHKKRFCIKDLTFSRLTALKVPFLKKKPFLDMVQGSICTKTQVSIIFRVQNKIWDLRRKKKLKKNFGSIMLKFCSVAELAFFGRLLAFRIFFEIFFFFLF